MQVKNIISFFFLFQSTMAFPRRNRNRNHIEATEIEIHHNKRSIESDPIEVFKRTPKQNQKGKAFDSVHVIENVLEKRTPKQNKKGKLEVNEIVIVG